MSDARESRSGGTEGGLLSWLETLLKFATAGLGLVAAIGLPAVAIHMMKFGVPIRTVIYQDVIYAGMLPALVLAVVAAYCVAAGQALKVMRLRQVQSIVALVGLLPLILIGSLSAQALFAWALLWPFRWLLEQISEIQIGNRTLLVVSGIVMLVTTPITWFFVAKADKHWSDDAEEINKVPPWWFSGGCFLVGSFFWLYCVKGILHIWDPQLGEALPHRYVIGASVGLGIAFTLVLVTLTSAEGTTEVATTRDRLIVYLLAVVVYVAFEVAYSMWGYPRLHSGLGGGLPQRVTLWLKQEDHANDIASVLTGAEVASAGSLRRVERVYVLLDREKELLLTDTAIGPGKAILVSKDRLMAISW